MVKEAVSAQGLAHCTLPGCTARLVGRGMCRKHYMAWWRATPVEERPPARNLKRLTPAERFANKVTKASDDDCWPWTGAGANTGFGHGTFFVSPERGFVQAHVFALELATGEPCPPGKEGCHHCDNPPCCNPRHVYYGTRQQNVDDMFARGRARVGAAKSNARYTDELIVSVRERFAAGEALLVLATELGTSTGYISRIVNGFVWKHAGGPITTRGHRGRPKSMRSAA